VLILLSLDFKFYFIFCQKTDLKQDTVSLFDFWRIFAKIPQLKSKTTQKNG